MPISGAAAKQFVITAALPPVSRGITEIEPPPITFDPAKDQAWVVGPQIFSFVKGVTAVRREMISTSALFASLAADAATPESKSEEWYKAYTKALTSLGWVLQEATRRRYAQEHSGSKVHEAVIEFVGALGVGGTALAIVTAALKAMQKVGDNKPWITLFDRQTRHENLTGFQVGLVDQKDEGDFQVRLMSFSLKLTQTNTQVLFIDFSTLGVEMESIGNTVTVSDAVLQEALPALKARLEGYMKSYVSEVKLPPLP